MSDNITDGLKKLIPDIQFNELLAPYTTWKIGGLARYFWEPDTERLPAVMSYCHQQGIPVWYLGRGSNVLIDSNGLDGLVICTKKALQKVEVDDHVITVEAGIPIPKLSKFAANLGWGGYEYLIGIPGTTGAGIAINAGLTANGRKEIGDVLIDVELMDKEGNIWWESKTDLELGYRSSNISERKLFVLKARFKATYQATSKEIKHKTAMHLAERRRKQPLSKATAGSTFKQPEGKKAAGWYIDRTGLKGFQMGGVRVSEKHANWVENIKNGTSDDMKKLINFIKEKVKKEYQIELETEVVYLK